jgi:hypothetical protein
VYVWAGTSSGSGASSSTCVCGSITWSGVALGSVLLIPVSISPRSGGTHALEKFLVIVFLFLGWGLGRVEACVYLVLFCPAVLSCAIQYPFSCWVKCRHFESILPTHFPIVAWTASSSLWYAKVKAWSKGVCGSFLLMLNPSISWRSLTIPEHSTACALESSVTSGL